MGKFRKAIASISMVAILSSLVVTTTAFAAYSDVPADHWAYDAVTAYEADGTLTPADTLRVNDPVNRAEMMKIIVGAADLVGDTLCSDTFEDVSVTDWFNVPCGIANQNGIFTGAGDGKMHGEGNINRADLSLVLFRLLGGSADYMGSDYFDDIDAGVYYDVAAGWARCYGIVGGYADGTYGPGREATRGEALVMVYRALGDLTLDAACTVSPDEPSEPDEPVVDATGSISVSLNDNSPTGATLPSKATSVEMVTWDFTAVGDDAVLRSFTAHNYGVNTLPSDHQVYLYEGGERLSSGRNVNSTTREASFNNLNIAIDKGDTVSLTLRMDVGTVTTTGDIGFEILNAEDVDAGGDVTGSFPVKGDVFGNSTTAAGTVTINKNGTVNNPSVGEKGATISKFKVSAATESASIEELGLYIQGTVSSEDVHNLKLYVSGEDDPIAEVEGLNRNDIAAFMPATPYLIDKGETRSFWVTAEFNTGRANDTVLAYIDETTDVVAIGNKYGYGMQVDINDADGYDGTTCTAAGSYADCTNATLEGGDITISGATITDRNIGVNQQDVEVLHFSITAEGDVTFNNFAIYLDTAATAEAADATAGLLNDTTDAANFTDIKITEVDGPHVWGPIDAESLLNGSVTGTAIADANDTDPGYYLFTDDLTLEAGETREFSLTLDVENNTALSNESLNAAVFIDATYPEVKDINNKVLTNASSLVPTSSYVGDTFTVKSDNLTITRSASVGSKSVVVNSENVALGAFSIGAGDAGDIKVTSIQVTGYIDDNGTTNLFVAGADTVGFNAVVLGMDLYAGSVAPENKINSSSKSADATTGEATFDNLNWVIPEGDTETLIVVATQIANNSTYDTDQLKIDFADVSSDFVAENESGSDIDSTSADTPNGGATDEATLYTQITISAGGTLAVDVPSETPRSEIVVAGTTGNEFTKLRFTATEETFTVTKLALKNDYLTTVGDYDDNISAVKVHYFTDEAQTQPGSTTCSSSATAGVYVCTGMTMVVPDPDLVGVLDYSTLTVTADLNDTANTLADEGDKPAFTASLAYDFDATGVSGKRIEESGTYDLLITDAAVGTYSDTTTGYDAVQAAEAVDTTETAIDVDDAGGADPGDINMVGAFLCLDSGDGAGGAADGDCDVAGAGAADEQVYVTAVTDGANSDTLTVIRGVNNTTGTALADDGTILTIPPSTALDTNYLQVQATDLSVSVAADSRVGGQSSTESVMTFTATPHPNKEVKIRQGATVATIANDGGGASLGTGTNPVAADASVSVDGSSQKITADAGIAANDSFYFVAGDMTSYTRASFWLNVTDQAADQVTDTVDYTQVTYFTAADATAAGDNSAQLANPVTTPLSGSWYFFDVGLPEIANMVAADVNFGLELDDVSALTNDTGGFELTDTVNVDQFRLYNEKINVDIKLNENWAAVTPTIAYLKQNNTIVADAYVDFDGAVALRTGQVQFVPVSTYSEIQIDSVDTFVVQMDTTTAITEDSGATENLTATIDFGNVSGAGDIYWYDGEDILNFFGINATDKVSVVSQY